MQKHIISSGEVRKKFCEYCHWLYRLLQINQVYNWRYKSKTHKYFNDLQGWLKHKVFTKVIKVPSLEAWVWNTESLIKSGRKCKSLSQKWDREVGMEVNIDNKSKLLLYRLGLGKIIKNN